MDMIGKVRRMHRRDKKSVREIARHTGLSRNTVGKWLEGPLEGQPKYRRGLQPGKPTVFHEALRLALTADDHRPKHERRTARALYAEIKAGGYAGRYTRVTDFIRGWRRSVGQAGMTKALVPPAFELGEAFQFDAHTRSFAALRIARRGIYDNMKTAVDKVLKGKGRAVGPASVVRSTVSWLPNA